MLTLLVQEYLCILHSLHSYLQQLWYIKKSKNEVAEHSLFRYTTSFAGYLWSLNWYRCSWSKYWRAWWGACARASSNLHVFWSFWKAIASWLSNLVKIKITGTENCQPSQIQLKTNTYHHLDQFYQRIAPLQLSPDEHCQLECSTYCRSKITRLPDDFQKGLPDCMKLILQIPCISSFRYEVLDGFHFICSARFNATWIMKNKSSVATEN